MQSPAGSTIEVSLSSRTAAKVLSPTKLEYKGSFVATVLMTLKSMEGFGTRLSTPETVTTWGTFQLEGVNVTVAGETVPAVVSLEVTWITTLESGIVESTM